MHGTWYQCPFMNAVSGGYIYIYIWLNPASFICQFHPILLLTEELSLTVSVQGPWQGHFEWSKEGGIFSISINGNAGWIQYIGPLVQILAARHVTGAMLE